MGIFPWWPSVFKVMYFKFVALTVKLNRTDVFPLLAMSFDDSKDPLILDAEKLKKKN